MFETIYSLEQVKHYTVCPIRPIGIQWSSTEWFGTATVCLFGGRLRPYNVAYLCGEWALCWQPLRGWLELKIERCEQLDLVPSRIDLFISLPIYIFYRISCPLFECRPSRLQDTSETTT